MSNIDWTKPVHTVGSKAPVRILCINAPGPKSVIGLHVDGEIDRFTEEGRFCVDNPSMRDLKNVPEWNLYEHITKYFRPLEVDEEPHMEGWCEKHLPAGWRPLLKGELYKIGDAWMISDDYWPDVNHDHTGTPKYTKFFRTQRPLPPLTKWVPWTFETRPKELIWIVRKNGLDERQQLLIGFSTRGVHASCLFVSYDILFDHWQQLDGLPCGTRVCES